MGNLPKTSLTTVGSHVGPIWPNSILAMGLPSLLIDCSRECARHFKTGTVTHRGYFSSTFLIYRISTTRVPLSVLSFFRRHSFSRRQWLHHSAPWIAQEKEDGIVIHRLETAPGLKVTDIHLSFIFI